MIDSPFSFNDAINYLNASEDQRNAIRSMLKDAVEYNILSFDSTSNQYSILLHHPSKRNDAGTEYPLRPEKISAYENQFRNARNIGMNDDYLRNTTIKEFLTKAIKNSLRAAVKDTSLYRYLNSNRTTLNAITAESIMKDSDLIQCLTDSVKDFSSGYRNWHKETCQNLISIFNRKYPNLEGKWTYGNSQKVLNLLVKYICVVSKRAKELAVLEDLQKLAQKFILVYGELDIPVDRYILRSSWNWNKRGNCNEIQLPSINEPRNAQFYQDGYVKNWSSWDKKDYEAYRESLHKAVKRPLDWEGYAWTEGKKEDKFNRMVSNRCFIKLFRE